MRWQFEGNRPVTSDDEWGRLFCLVRNEPNSNLR